MMKPFRLSCRRCGGTVEKETKLPEYPYYCPHCDENLFSFEVDELYRVRYRGCYKYDGGPDPDDHNVGKIFEWTMTQILDDINRDRSSGWTDYDETDWEEGLDEWTYYEPVKENADGGAE